MFTSSAITNIIYVIAYDRMLIGVAAGSAGIFAVSLWCPHDGLMHIGIWHGGAVMLMGLAGRLVLPRFIAW